MNTIHIPGVPKDTIEYIVKKHIGKVGYPSKDADDYAAKMTGYILKQVDEFRRLKLMH